MSLDPSATIGRRQGTSRYIALFDECGDHSLTKIDRDFPVFVLSTVVVERESYVHDILPALGVLKLRFFEHEGVNLHSRDIRLATGDYAFLQVPARRAEFMVAVGELVRQAPFTLFIVAIRKDRHLAQFGPTARSPYDLALEHTMEMMMHFLDGCGEAYLPLVAEARGKNEDDQLRAAFDKLMSEGTRTQAAERFRRLQCPLTFRRKNDNIGGLQLADLCAHPAARAILKPAQASRALEAVNPHVYTRDGVRGWLVLPEKEMGGTDLRQAPPTDREFSVPTQV